MDAKTTTNDPRLKDYEVWDGEEPFEDYIGPLYFKPTGSGSYTCAFVAERRHCNGSGNLHGGMLMSFADYALFMIARDELEGTGGSVTISFASEFVAAARQGAFVEATGEVIRRTGSLVFVRGTIFTGETTLLNFSGILKTFGKRN